MTNPPAPSEVGSPPAFSPATMIGVLLIASFMDLVDVTIVAVAAPNIQSSLGASSAQLQWMIAAYALSLGAALITGGRIGDSYGRRRIFLAGLSVFVVASAACALAPTAGVLIATRVVQGLAAGLMIPQVFGIIRSSLSPQQMGAALGAYGGVQGLASIAGPLLGGLLISANLFDLGWRTVFWINVPVGIVALLIGRRVLPESRQPQAARLDLLGATLLAVSLVLVLLPVVQGQSWGWPVWGWVLLAAGLAGLGVFLAVEKRLAARNGQPVLDPALLKNRAFTGGLVASLVFFGGIASFFLLLSIYLQDGTGRTALATGLVTLPYALGSILTSGLGVKLAARHGRRLLVVGCLVIAASHAVLWAVVSEVENPSWWQIGAPLLLGGLGLGLAAPPLVNVILAAVPGRSAGAAGGVLSTINQVGGSIGIAALGALFFAEVTSSTADGGAPTAYGHAFTSVLPWQVGLYLVAAVLMTLLPAGTGTPTRAASPSDSRG